MSEDTAHFSESYQSDLTNRISIHDISVIPKLRVSMQFQDGIPERDTWEYDCFDGNLLRFW